MKNVPEDQQWECLDQLGEALNYFHRLFLRGEVDPALYAKLGASVRTTLMTQLTTITKESRRALQRKGEHRWSMADHAMYAMLDRR
jgi:hypothetical protein